MNYVVLLTPDAEDDLARLEDFLVERDASAAIRAAVVIAEAIASLSEHPDRGVPGFRPGVRRIFAPFGASAYVIEYRVDPGKVIIARIFHGREDRPLA